MFTGVVTIITAAGIIIVGTAITDGIVIMDGMGITIAVTGVDPDGSLDRLCQICRTGN
jgi:hypothetical protein